MKLSQNRILSLHENGLNQNVILPIRPQTEVADDRGVVGVFLRQLGFRKEVPQLNFIIIINNEHF